MALVQTGDEIELDVEKLRTFFRACHAQDVSSGTYANNIHSVCEQRTKSKRDSTRLGGYELSPVVVMIEG